MQDIIVPEIGENVTTGTVVNILVAVGDMVAEDDPVVEFETEKAVVEIPSPTAGRIAEILVKTGDDLKIGDVIARLDVDAAQGAAAEPSAASPENPSPRGAPPSAAASPAKAETSTGFSADQGRERPPAPNGARAGAEGEISPETRSAGPIPATPSVRRLARELGLNIHAVKGSGPGGRITHQDVKNHVKQLAAAHPPADVPAEGRSAAHTDLPDFSRWGKVEHVELTAVRRLTAESMSLSWRRIPQVTQFDRADITRLDAWLRQTAGALEQEGGRLTITAILLKVTALGLKQFPRFNASIDPQRQQLILKKYVHIGMAVATDRGLLVPVIRDADQRSLKDLSLAVADAAAKARKKRLLPDDMQGGTFTVSNQGGIGGTQFTPIVYWPQAAILGVSRAAVEPRYIDDRWEPRTMLPLALSYDHRINDGADAARFLRWICAALEQPMHLFL